jgi:murein DD-endopeptidase MepM/ murein hydrolase activator NlpD
MAITQAERQRRIEAGQKRLAERRAAATQQRETEAQKITSIAKPKEAITAVQKAAEAGAFTLRPNEEVPTKTPELEPERTKAGTLIGPDDDPFRMEAADIQEKLFDERTLPTSLEDQVERLKKAQARELRFAEGRGEASGKIEESAFQTMRGQTRSQMAGVTSAFAQGREGLIGSSTARIGAEFAEAAGERIAQAFRRKEMAQNRRDKLLEDLRKAQREGREAAALGIQERLSIAEADAAKAEKNLLEEQRETEKQAAELRGNATAETMDIFGAMGGSMGKLSNEELAAMIQGTNLTMSQALAIQNQKVLEQEVLEAKTDQEKELKQAQLEQTNANIEKINAQTLKVVAETTKISTPASSTSNFTLSGTRLVTGGASNGAGRVDPIGLINAYNFGTGQAGQIIKDVMGNEVGRISSPYGADHSQISGEKNHNGIDIVFNEGKALALQGGTVVKKGFAQNTYGGYVWIAGQDGQVMQYGHLNPDDLAAISAGTYVDPGQFLARQETNPSRWGASSGPHTDLRFVGNADQVEDPVISSYGYQILDGKINLSNVTGGDKEETAALRSQVSQFVQMKQNEGYKLEYPVLTDSQVKLVNTLADDYNGNKRISSMLDVESGWDTVRSLYSSDEKMASATGFDDIAAINAFQRMVDPGATVREGDVTLLQTSIPFLERVSPTFRWSQFQKGDKLPVEIRQSLQRVAKELYNTKARNINGTSIKALKDRAEASGIDNFGIIGQEFVIYGDEGDTAQSDLEFLSAPSEAQFSSEDLGQVDSIYAN